MVETVKKVCYQAFGLSISSEIFLPELQLTSNFSKVDVSVRISDLSNLWIEFAVNDCDFIIKENFIMFNIYDTAIFLIQNGKDVFISPYDGFEEAEVRQYLLGTCMGAILLQRNILPLHGSAIIIDGKAYAIVGDSGAGKSTLAAAFIKQGFQLLSDDVIPVRLTVENVPIVIPAYPQQKLWEESMIHFGLDANEFQPLVARDTKYAIPIYHHFSNKPFPLEGVFELEAADQYEITIQPINQLERFYKLFKHTYRNFFIQQAGLMDWHFSTSAKMINHIKMFQLRRPNSHFTADKLAELILFRLKKETV